MLFKDKLNEIFGLGAPTATIPQEEPKDVIQLTPIEDFRKNVSNILNGIKDNAIMGVVANAPQQCQKPTIPPVEHSPMGGDGMMVERDNEIGLETLKGSIRKMGPQKVSEVIAKLSAEKNEVDKSTGIATSEFDKFVDGLKQEAAEALLGSEATPSTPNTPEVAPIAGPDGVANDATPKTPEQKLPDLVQTKL